jgi:hypothetical protein
MFAVPLLDQDNRSVDCLLSEEVMEGRAVSLGEVSQQGSAPDLVELSATGASSVPTRLAAA